MRILYCASCERFTLAEKCSTCHAVTVSTAPAKFSPEDKLGKYRRLAKKEEKA